MNHLTSASLFSIQKREIQEEEDPLWYMDTIIYEVDVKGFYDSNGDGIGDFKGLTQKLDYIKELGITATWLLPFYPSPLKDDGYDISDYCNIHPQYGTLLDFRRFLNEAHLRDIKVITELVLNHTSDQHSWFQRARRAKAGSKWRNFYVWSDTPDKFRLARVIFKDFETSNWAWDPVANAYYWHRFYSHQPDLNFDSSYVQQEIFKVVDFWLGMGVDGLRLDAVPYLFEREGTNCENLPETHDFLKKLRQHMDSKFRNKMLLAEANQWPSDAASYFGNGDECHMAFHFPLMPRMFVALQTEDRFPIVEVLQQTPKIPENCQWALFLRNHDELTLEMVTDEERDYMYRSFAKDNRARINLGIRRRLAPILENDRRKIELLNVLLPTLPGIPVIYRGDEIGMGDNYYLGDRNGVRTPMQWNANINAGFSRANPQRLYLPIIIDPEYHYEAVNVENQLRNPSSLLWWTKRLIVIVRKHFKAFGRGEIEFLYPENNKIFAFIRRYKEENLLVAINLSRNPQFAEVDLGGYEGRIPLELFGGTRFPTIARTPYLLTFGPYGYYIFNLTEDKRDGSDGLGSQDRNAPLGLNFHLQLQSGFDQLFEETWYKEKLESEILPAFIRGQRWFRSKASQIERVSVKSVIRLSHLDGTADRVLLVSVSSKGIHPENYFIPVVFRPMDKCQQLISKNPDAIISSAIIDGTEGLIYDGVYDEGLCSALLSLIRRRKREEVKTFPSLNEAPTGEDSAEQERHILFRGNPREKLRVVESQTSELTSRVLGIQQSNTSVAYGRKLIIKLFRRAEEGVNPELEIGNYLAGRSFHNVPPILGDIIYQEKAKEPTIVAVLEEFIENQGDAWSLCVDEMGRFFERALASGQLPKSILLGSFYDLALRRVDLPDILTSLITNPFLDLIRLLGKRTAEFHLALSSETDDPAFSPEAFDHLYQQSLATSLISYTQRVFEIAKRSKVSNERIRREIDSIISSEKEILKHFDALKRENIDALKTRTHGDYHLGQVIYTGKDFFIIDFEGEPARSIGERRIKRSPLRDVAGMIRSFHYASHAGLLKQTSLKSADIPMVEEWTDLWYKACAATFLKSYLELTSRAPIVPKNENHLVNLLNAFLFEKAVYELAYELNNRPDWVGIPIKGIKELLGN